MWYTLHCTHSPTDIHIYIRKKKKSFTNGTKTDSTKIYLNFCMQKTKLSYHCMHLLFQLMLKHNFICWKTTFGYKTTNPKGKKQVREHIEHHGKQKKWICTKWDLNKKKCNKNIKQICKNRRKKNRNARKQNERINFQKWRNFS